MGAFVITPAVFAPRAAVHLYSKLDGDVDRSTYAAAYRVDMGARTMEVDKFTRVFGEARRVHKLPIFCWSEFESLRETLEKMGPVKPVSG